MFSPQDSARKLLLSETIMVVSPDHLYLSFHYSLTLLSLRFEKCRSACEIFSTIFYLSFIICHTLTKIMVLQWYYIFNCYCITSILHFTSRGSQNCQSNHDWCLAKEGLWLDNQWSKASCTRTWSWSVVAFCFQII